MLELGTTCSTATTGSTTAAAIVSEHNNNEHCVRIDTKLRQIALHPRVDFAGVSHRDPTLNTFTFERQWERVDLCLSF